VGDGLAWLGLTVVLIVTGRGSTGQVVVTMALAVVLGLVTVVGLRPGLAAVVRRLDRQPRGEQLLLPVLAAGAIGLATATQVIGLHPVIGAFLFGLVVPRGSAAVGRANQRLQGYAMTILLPLFFAGVGLTASVGLLGGSVARWAFFGGVLAVAVCAKFLGASAAARLAGLPGRESLQLGALMNCRGVTEVVMASIGLQYHLINRVGFTILVLMALITTATTTPLLRAFGSGSADSPRPLAVV
jgi:Kef-type K+ transport system membrane component KefB